MPQSFQREGDTNDNSIQSYNFGGLNTTANRLNTPYTDATVLLNVNTGLDGSLMKRQGSKMLVNGENNTESATPLTSVLGYEYMVCVSGNSLQVYSRSNDTMLKVRQWTSVFAPRLLNKTITNWVQLPDTYSRVLGLNADYPPVEVYIVEGRYNFTTVTPANSVQIVTSKFSGDNSSATTATLTDLVHITRGDGTKTEHVVTYTYNSGTKTMTLNLPFTTAANESIVVDIVGFRWCWWAESIKWQGDRFFDTISRFNVTVNDNNIPIPAPLRSDVTIGEESLVQLLSKTSSTVDAYTFAAQPTTADQYNLSDGSVYVPGTNNFINQSLYFITFGATRTPLPQPSESVKMIRFRELRFLGGVGIQASSLRVTVNDNVIPQSFTGVLSSGLSVNYHTYSSSLTINTVGTQQAKYIGFSSSVPMGVGAIDIVTLTNTVNPRIGGLQVEIEESSFKSGAYYRCYGIGQFASYSSTVNSYPSTGCVYQGRLCLSGVSVDKSRIVLSGTGDGNERYNFFQITDDLDNLPTDPLDIIISGGDSADYIVGMVEWNNSLFTLTRRSVYRVSGGDQPLTSTRKLVTYISNVGLVNTKCLVRTDTAVYYLSDGGVFNLTPKVEDSEFNAIEKSLKVRGAFIDTDISKLVTSSCMLFNSRTRRLYVTLPNNDDLAGVASKLYVLDTVRDSWTLYETLGNYRTSSLVNVTDNATKQTGVTALTTLGVMLLEASGVYTDRTITHIAGVGQIVSDSVVVGSAVPAIEGGQRYAIPNGIQVSSITDVKDLLVYVSTGILTPAKVEFTKGVDSVYLTDPTTSSQTVWFVSKSPCNDTVQGELYYGTGDVYPYTITKNGVVVKPTSESLVFSVAAKLVFVQFDIVCNPGDVVTVGNHYYSQYVSSMFTQQQLGNFKRTKHAYLYFNNGEDATINQNVFIEGYKTRVNCNVAMLYDSDDTDATTSADIYGYQDIVWDNAYFDTPESSKRSQQYSLFKEPLVGIGYSYRLAVFSYDDARWHLVGYQITTTGKGLRYTDSV